jgi:hypothetical protein
MRVGRLRPKLETDLKNAEMVKAVRGGYVLASAVVSR